MTPQHDKVRIILRSRLESESIHLLDGSRLKVINDVRRPLSQELIDRYELSHEDIYDLYDYIDSRKKELIEGHLEQIDRFYFGFRGVIKNKHFTENILLYHFSSKRTDMYPTFKRFCVISLRDHIAAQFPSSKVSFDLETSRSRVSVSWGAKMRFVRNAAAFFVKIVLVRLILGIHREMSEIKDADLIFYTQYSRQRMPGFDNVNYGAPFNALSQRHRCLYILNLITDGIHESASIAEIYARSRFIASIPKPICIMEQFIDGSLMLRAFHLLIEYIKAILSLKNVKMMRLNADDIYVFQDEVQPTIGRLFNYAYVLELSKNLASVIRNQVFVYYLFEQNYGKLLAFHLHDNNTTIGCQHGTISHLRLGQYLTPEEQRSVGFPTQIIAEGDNHKESLEWIHPYASVNVLGAPRVDSLASLPVGIGIDRLSNDRPTRILVPLSLHGDLSILDIVAETLDRLDNVFFFIKPHPSAHHQKNRIAARLGGLEGEGHKVYMNSVYELAGQVDYVLFADTSVGIEFAELGVTPLYVEPIDDLNLSPVTDVLLFHPELNVDDYRVTCADDLVRILMNYAPERNKRIFPNDFFFANFGRAVDGWTEFLESRISERVDR